MLQWTVVIPVKRLALAKSRLADPPRNRDLALAFANDTLAAVAGTPGIARIIVVTDDEQAAAAAIALGALVRPDVRRGGLNAAVREGARYAVGSAGPHPVAGLPSDLPALSAAALAQALAAAANHELAFVPDAADSGTTLLTAVSGDLRPRYGADSARAHARDGAVRLSRAGPRLRQDVDTPDDLLAACALGLGPATEAVLAGPGWESVRRPCAAVGALRPR